MPTDSAQIVNKVWNFAHVLRDRIRTGVEGFHDVKISAMAEEMVEVALRNG